MEAARHSQCCHGNSTFALHHLPSTVAPLLLRQGPTRGTSWTTPLLMNNGPRMIGCSSWPVAAAQLRGVNSSVGRKRGGSFHARPWKRAQRLPLGDFIGTPRRRKDIVEEACPPIEVFGCNAQFWGKVVEDLHSFWNRFVTDDTQTRVRNGLGQQDIGSQLLHFTLIFSLYLANPLWEPASVLAKAETLDTIEQPHIWQQRTSNFRQDLQVESGDLTQKDYIQSGSQRTWTSTAKPLKNSKPVTMFSLAKATKACEESYGFLPCSDSIGGTLSLIAAYGYFLLLAAQLISNGSERLLEVMNPGLLGGLLLPFLGALPDTLLILVSGIGGTPEEAQQQVMVGIGVLAGSTVMLITIGWAGSLYAGRCDLSGPGGIAQDRTLSRPLDWTGTGVTTDEQTRVGAWIMVLSTLPFVVVQIPLLNGHPAEGPEAALVGSIVALVGVLAYSFYQVSYPWLQQKRIEEARLQFLRSRALQRVSAFSGKRNFRRRSLLQVDGAIDEPYQRLGSITPELQQQYPRSSCSQLWMEAGRCETEKLIGARRLREETVSGPSHEVLKDLFASFDTNSDGKIQREELKGLLIGLELEEDGSIPDKTQIDLWLKEFDVDLDGTLSEQEFLIGIGKWAQRISQKKVSRKIRQLENSLLAGDDRSFWAVQSFEAKKVLDVLEAEAADDEDEEEETEVKTVEAGSIKKTAALYLLGGAGLAALFADPLVSSIGGFSEASGIPPFFVAFVVTPFASNASELFSSIIFARAQRKKNISLTFSQLYGGVTMNNTLCLGLFLGVVYVRGLNWDFSSEVTVILLSVAALGAIGGSRTTFPLWFALPVLAIYPLCISLVAILDNFLGWH